MKSLRIRLSAILGLLGVILGASGAHGSLHDRLIATGELAHWQTAVQYHLIHAVLAVALALCSSAGGKRAQWAWRCLVMGILLFSGSLYVLAITQIKSLGAVTPFGGLSLMLGWLLLAAAKWDVNSREP